MRNIVYALLFTACGCCCREKVITLPADPAIAEQIRNIVPADDPLVAETPIVDVHTHTFNARYLPIRGILLGKRDKFLFTRLIPDPVAILFAKIITRTTELPDIPLHPGLASTAPPSVVDVAKELDERPTLTENATLTHPLITGGIKVMARDEPIEKRVQLSGLRMMREQSELLRTGSLELTTSERTALAQMDEVGKEGFLKVIRRSDATMDALHKATYGDQVKLIVSHMMDLGPVYDQRPEDRVLLDVASEQESRYAYFQSLPDARTVYFVAFNPYRNHWNGGKPGDALAVVKDAVRNRGAFGVKFYPPSGYRPFGNRIPERPVSFFSLFPGWQWDGRYKGVTDGQLDDEVRELLEYCEANQIPVFAHCNTGEFEARSGYGRTMADPKWWKRYLEEHTRKSHRAGEPCRLRLCLGHAGGAAYLFGQGIEEDFEWGETVLELCRTYPNVYCEVGALDEILRGDRQAYFVEQLAKLLHTPPRPGESNLADKIMYGTDWNMDTAISAGREYLTRYQQAFLHPNLREDYAKFFFYNAMDFLDVSGSIAERSLPPGEQRRPIPREVRTRLEDLASRREQLLDASRDRDAERFLDRQAEKGLTGTIAEDAAKFVKSVNGRPLTAGEISFLRTIFGDAVPYAKVTISRGNAFEKRCDAYTIVGHIRYSNSAYRDDFSARDAAADSLPLLAHEITHVWQQYDWKQFCSWPRALNELILYGKKAYQFKLCADRKLTDYRFEQQGAIVQEYANNLLAWKDPWSAARRRELEAVIYRSIPKPRL